MHIICKEETEDGVQVWSYVEASVILINAESHFHLRLSISMKSDKKRE